MFGFYFGFIAIMIIAVLIAAILFIVLSDGWTSWNEVYEDGNLVYGHVVMITDGEDVKEGYLTNHGWVITEGFENYPAKEIGFEVMAWREKPTPPQKKKISDFIPVEIE